jgi:adenosylhomocysteine nucleosidase
MPRVAIVAALEREVRPLVKSWRATEREHDGRRFRFFENGEIVLICAGIGAAAARRGAEAAIAKFGPKLIYSAGFAGALNPKLRVGDVVRPRVVINAADGSRIAAEDGEGVLVSFGSIASPEQKTKLHVSFGGDAVDMEAAAVACAADARGIAFRALKAISDEIDFDFPATQRFVDSEGKFSEVSFALFAAVRPWLWSRVLHLARNSKHASHSLCDALRNLSATGELEVDRSKASDRQ